MCMRTRNAMPLDARLTNMLYCTVVNQRMVILHVFVKKSRKTPRRALETARQRQRRLLAREAR